MAIFRKRPAAPPRPVPDPIPDPPVEPPAEILPPSADGVSWDLAHLVGLVRDAAPALEAKEVEGILVQSRLADHYRDSGLSPLNAARFQFQTQGLDIEGWRRLALAVATLDDPEIRAVLPALAPRMPVTAQVEEGFLRLAFAIDPLTVRLVRQSVVRAEEFARHFAARLGIGIAGESAQESRDRLQALDYKRLLAEAERAKAAAHDQMERLRKLQDDADRGRRRGKW